MAGSAEHDHVLKDGTTVHLRPLRRDDAQRLLAMWSRTSEPSRRARFPRTGGDLDGANGGIEISEGNIDDFVQVDEERDFAVVATLGRDDSERIVGVARFRGQDAEPGTATFGVLVQDDDQGRGIGTALGRHVAQVAVERGIRTLVGDLAADNARMLGLLGDLGIEVTTRPSEGTGRDRGDLLRADLDLDLDDDFLRVVDDDERAAAQAALQRFFTPQRIAVVGASRDPNAIGGLVLRNLLDGGFNGVVHPINPNATEVQGLPAHPRLSDCPEVPDLVIVCVPAALVGEVVDEAGRLGVRAVCVVSAGFGEMGTELGRDRQDQLLAIARSHGLRIIGPNCMGLLNGAADVRMNGTFSTTFPAPGRLAFSSQSGALGLAVLEHVHGLGLGISTFVSVGNKADISGNDLLLFWEDDPNTDVILLYLESFGNPRKFSRIARRISRHKPIVAVKSGRTAAGERAASSHTAAVSSGDVAVDALFRQTGVLRTDTLEELFDVAGLLSRQPLPRGRNVAILTNAGGPGILAADALEAAGLHIPTLHDDTVALLREFLPPEAGLSNPVDMIASATADGFSRAVQVLGNAAEVDALFVIFIEAGATTTEGVAEGILRARTEVPADVPLVMVSMGSRGEVPILEQAGIPTFAFPENAARALGRVAGYADWRRRPLGQPLDPSGIDRARGRAIVEAALRSSLASPDDVGSGGRKRLIGQPHTARAIGQRVGVESGHTTWLTSSEAEGLLDAYGITQPRSVVVHSAEEAAAATTRLREASGCGAVVVKVASPIHKSDVGGVRVGLTTPGGAARAVQEMTEALIAAGMGEHAERFLVQEMVEDGIEMVVGVSHDPSFGPLLVTGMGGTLVELYRDVSVRVTPVTDIDLDEMLDGLRMKPLLTGYRGAPRKDITALKDLLARVNAMVEDLPEIAELDCNPVFVRDAGRGAVAVDVRCRVAQP